MEIKWYANCLIIVHGYTFQFTNVVILYALAIFSDKQKSTNTECKRGRVYEIIRQVENLHLLQWTSDTLSAKIRASRSLVSNKCQELLKFRLSRTHASKEIPVYYGIIIKMNFSCFWRSKIENFNWRITYVNFINNISKCQLKLVLEYLKTWKIKFSLPFFNFT